LTVRQNPAFIGFMKTKTSLLIFAICFAAGISCFASPQMGTWQLNEAKSKFPTGMAKNKTVVYAPAGDRVKVTVDGIDGRGNAAHHEWIGKFDGKEYAVKGDPSAETRSYKVIDDRTLDMQSKQNGKVALTARISVSSDGKSRTVTSRRTDVNGWRFTSIAIYDKK
jgi:hypothetical protein